MSETDFKPQTIARLFHTVSFEDETKITKNTLKGVNEYLKLFTAEAVLRSNEHRLEKLKEGGISELENTLEVGDLEKVAGLLVLDF